MDEQSIFLEAIQKDTPAERRAFLEQACGGDEKLRHDVELLLRANVKLGDFLQRDVQRIEETVELPAPEPPGTQIGAYKIRERLAEGGMGVVYVAKQTEPVRRKVALKIIRPGMTTKDVVARFEAERQALAMMDHPNIARVFDGGATETGQPFFVMELVQGVPITEYCDQQKMTGHDRLALCLDVCRAVQHAHQKGVIHRDIKPSNVLVAEIDGQAVPKIIDFGVAKAIHQKLVEQTIYTQFSQMVGTPLYMSPEQAGAGVVDVDTRSDVYSLGVLLYELLTGHTPFDRETLKRAGLDEMRRIIREDEPPPPSARVSTLRAEEISTIAQRRGSDQRKYPLLLRGELDWIVMRALEKDRRRRYQSPGELADDLQRYLDHEPVEACPPSPMYRLRKFTHRHKPVLMTAAVVFLALTAGTGIAAWQAVRASRAEQQARDRLVQVDRQRKVAEKQRQAAELAAAQSQAVTKFLTNDMLGSARPEETRGRKVTVEEVLANAEKEIEAAFEDQPLIEAVIRQALGSTYHALGDYAGARKHIELANEIQHASLDEEHPDTLQSAANLANAVLYQGRYGEAEELHRTVLEIRKRVQGEEHPDTFLSMNNLAAVMRAQGHYGEAEKRLRKALELQERVLGEEHPETLASTTNLAGVLFWQGRYADAEELSRQLLEVQERMLGKEHPSTLQSANILAVAVLYQGRDGEAEELLRELLETQERVLGKEHPETLASMHNLAAAIEKQGRYSEAEELFRKVLEDQKRMLDQEHPDTLLSMHKLAFVLEEQGKLDDAIARYKKVIEVNPENGHLHNELAWLLATCSSPEHRNPDEAVAYAKTAVELVPSEGGFWNTLGVAHCRDGNWESAIRALERAMQPRDGGNSYDWFFLAMAQWQLGQKEKARQWHEKATQWMEQHAPKDEELVRFREEAEKVMGIGRETERGDEAVEHTSKDVISELPRN